MLAFMPSTSISYHVGFGCKSADLALTLQCCFFSFLFTGLKKLESLNISCCKCITDMDMKAISGTCLFTFLFNFACRGTFICLFL